MEEVRKVYKKVCADSRYSMANHNILVYVTDEEEGYCDDGEWGGRKTSPKETPRKRRKKHSGCCVQVAQGAAYWPQAIQPDGAGTHRGSEGNP